MAASGITKRYAEAVFEIANENNSHEAWLRDLAVLAAAANDYEIGRFFANPAIPLEQKETAVANLLRGDGQQQVRNLGRMLVARQRFEMLPDLLEAVTDLIYEQRNIAIATVTTAIELDAEERSRVAASLQRLVGREIEMRTEVDPSIIGGIVARVGDRKIDGSVETQLHNLRTTLSD